MNLQIPSILLTEETLRGKVQELGARVSADYRGEDLLLVGILKGSVIFLSDLLRCITIPVEIDFMAVSSYGKGHVSTGEVRILKDLDTPVRDKHILIVEDILDSGRTLRYIMNLMEAANPASVSVCALLDKPARRIAPVECRYPPIPVPDEFLVGYGMDYAEKYRNLPYIGILPREAILCEDVKA